MNGRTVEGGCMRLMLARHGKAAHNAAYERYVHGDRHAFYDKPDLEAPLMEIGMRQARAAGKYLRDHGILPDVVKELALPGQTWLLPDWPAFCTQLRNVFKSARSIHPGDAVQVL